MNRVTKNEEQTGVYLRISHALDYLGSTLGMLEVLAVRVSR